MVTLAFALRARRRAGCEAELGRVHILATPGHAPQRALCAVRVSYALVKGCVRNAVTCERRTGGLPWTSPREQGDETPVDEHAARRKPLIDARGLVPGLDEVEDVLLGERGAL